MDYGRWNEWDGLWTEGNTNESWSIKPGLKEMRWNMNNQVDNVRMVKEVKQAANVREKCKVRLIVVASPIIGNFVKEKPTVK